MSTRLRRAKILLGAGALLIAILLLFSAYFYRLTHLPLPDYDGEYVVGGLREKVEILRDEWGVPHIYADSSYDLFFAQGFTQAQDRWWQMEFSRHLSQGRLCELVGAAPLASDLRIRALGLRHVAESEWPHYDLRAATNLQAFADGVNAYLDLRDPGSLAVEYGALGLAGLRIEVAPWSPIDTLTYAKFASYGLSANAQLEAIYTDLIEQLGPEMAGDFLPDFPYEEKPTILQVEDFPLSGEHLAVRQTVPEGTPPEAGLASTPGDQAPGTGSNSWVVSGRLTKSGKPLLANDLHLAIDLPSIWYEVGLHCREISQACPYNVTGFTFAPFPGVTVGHNQSIAWGVTVAGADVQDIYYIRASRDDPFVYEWNGAWRKMTVNEEKFRFADGTDGFTVPMRVTHLGPIINDYSTGPESKLPGSLNRDDPQALRWTALDPQPSFHAIFELNQATNWHEFRHALEQWNFGALNFVYADILGNIGYQMPGRIPIRAEGHSGMTVVPGWTDAFDWQGYIPYDWLPRLFDPAAGYIVSANQKAVPPSYWDYLAAELGSGRDYDFQEIWPVYGYRAQRIEELLANGRPHTVLTFEAMLSDTLLIHARELFPYLADLDIPDPEMAVARDWLLGWDFRLDAQSAQGAFYAFLWRSILDNLYADSLEGLPPATARQMWPTTRLLAEPENLWWDDIRTPDIVESRDDILIDGLSEAYQAAVATLGADRLSWQWGDVHTATFVNWPLGESEIDIVERVVNRGPYSVGGGANVINATGWSESPENYYVASDLPSMRMVIDLANLGGSVAINSTGQSGHVASDHYDDMIQLWQANRYHPMLWTRAQVERSAASVLFLEPVFVEGTECCQK